MISVTLKELDDIEKQMSPINSYAFNSRSITQNGNFAYAAERERDMSGDIDYYELLGINRDFPKREASRIIRMYNMYKSKIKKWHMFGEKDFIKQLDNHDDMCYNMVTAKR